MSPVKSTPRLVSTEAVKQLRERIAVRDILEESKLKSDKFLLRYLRSNNFNVDKAERMIETYVETLEEKEFEKLETETFPEEFTDKFATYSGGWDNEGRPIAMVPHGGLWNLKEAIQNGNEEMFIRYIYKLTSTFEKLILETDSDYGVLVCDVSNVAYGNYFHKGTLEVLLYLIRLIEKIAPGLIGKVYLVNASKLMVTLFSSQTNGDPQYRYLHNGLERSEMESKSEAIYPRRRHLSAFWGSSEKSCESLSLMSSHQLILFARLIKLL